MGFEQLFEFRKYSLAQRNSRATATTSTRLNIYLTPASTVRSAMPHAEPVAAVPTDAALIAAWQGGDEQAAAELVRRHERALAGEAEGRLLAGLGRLSRMQREVFLLRAQQGLAYEEIAAALGTSPGAARVHYHHAVKRLKEYLA